MPLLDDCSAWWELDETSGTRVDAHTNGLDLTDNNTVPGVAGKIGNAADFTAANTESLSNSGNDSFFQIDNDFSLTCWVKLKNLTAIHDLFTKWGATTNREWSLLFLNGTNRFQYYHGYSSGGFTVATANSFGAPSADTWYFLAALFDSDASTHGNLGISVNAGTIDWASNSQSHQFAGTDPVRLGEIGPGSSRNADAVIDQAIFWKRLITQDEIDEIYNSGSGMSYPATLCDMALKGTGR